MADDGGVEFWTPPPIWRGETVICVGGGPSLRGFDFESLRGSRVMAVNAAAYDLPFADAMFFFDTRFFFDHRALVSDFRGLVLTPAAPAKAALPDKINLLQLDERAPFSIGCSPLHRGRSSGHCAVIAAIAMAAARIVLLGFDCRTNDARSHYHDRYREPHTAIYGNDFAPAWRGYRARAVSLGCEIINAGPSSALTEFPFLPIDQIIGAGS